MAERTSKITLEAGTLRQEFTIPHAERLLSMQNSGGWEIPKDSAFKYDRQNGITRKSNKGATKKSGKEADNK